MARHLTLTQARGGAGSHLLHHAPRARERRRRTGHGAGRLRGHAAPAARPRLPSWPARASWPPSCSTGRSTRCAHTTSTQRPGSFPDAPVMGLDVYNPWSADERQGLAQLRQQGRRGAGLVRGQAGGRRRVRLPRTIPRSRARRRVAARRRRLRPRRTASCRCRTSTPRCELTRRHLGAQGETEQAFAELLASDWVARP